jgi:hypothetical protein
MERQHRDVAQERVGGHNGLLIVPGFWQANPRRALAEREGEPS